MAHASPRQSSPIGSLPAVTDTAHASPGQSSALPAHSPLPVSSAVLSGPSSTLSPSPSPVPPTSCRMSQHDGPSSTLDAIQSSVYNSLAQQSSPSSAHTSSTPVSSPTVPVAASTVRNIHPMFTRAKAGIVKPKLCLCRRRLPRLSPPLFLKLPNPPFGKKLWPKSIMLSKLMTHGT